MLYDETQQLLQMYFLLEYWGNEYKRFRVDLRQRLELPFADALENPAVITGLTYHERRERFGKKGQKLKKDAIVYKFPNQNLDTSDGWNNGDSVHFVTLDNEIKPIGVADLDFEESSISFIENDALLDSNPNAVTSGKYIGPGAKEQRLFELIENIAADVSTNNVAQSILAADKPRYLSVEANESPGSKLEEVKKAVLELDNSYLAIQGPPGTGKTWTGSRLIAFLLSEGKRVGITAQSWAAIDNLLRKTIEFIDTQKISTVKAARLFSEKPAEIIESKSVEYLQNETANLFEEYNLVASTTWFYAKEGFGDSASFDYLIIDEAGQLSLADTLAISSSTKNIVLLGDPQQLPQVNIASHQAGSGSSVLEHVLAGNATINPEFGFLLNTTFRMASEICEFISEEFYEAKLNSHDICNRRNLGKDDNGLRWVPVQHHEDRVGHSIEEANMILAIVKYHLGKTIVGIDPQTNEEIIRTVNPLDFKIVTPYNAQKFLIRNTLTHAGIGEIDELVASEMVGTVDKFQGQEAPIVIYSLTTSRKDLVPAGRGEFIFLPNRLNVAVSRAQCLAYLVGSEELINARAKSIEEMASLNHFCRFVDDASTEWHPVDTLSQG